MRSQTYVSSKGECTFADVELPPELAGDVESIWYSDNVLEARRERQVNGSRVQSPCTCSCRTSTSPTRGVRAGATSRYAPTTHPYGERSGGVRDRWGNDWFLVTLVDAEKRRPS
ncbi:MAG: hypothetical protein HZA52_17955 [Planctomycetes bacterium]|nr:hypothetical protein [Planctomycetota bacterium]